MGSKKDWEESLDSLFLSYFRQSRLLHLLGVGNSIRRDDGVGLFIAAQLIKKYGTRPNKKTRIHPASNSLESLLSRLSETGDRVLLFDSVENKSEPGSIILAGLDDTRFGFFATHNIPLRLIPNITENMSNLHVLGVEPETVEIGEGLSDSVRKSALQIVSKIGALVVRGG